MPPQPGCAASLSELIVGANRCALRRSVCGALSFARLDVQILLFGYAKATLGLFVYQCTIQNRLPQS